MFFEQTKNFDIESFLQDFNISYNSTGKNIGSSWIGLNCVFCLDPSTHLGINLGTKQINCWKCGGHSLLYFIQEVAICSKEKALDILFEYNTEEKQEKHRIKTVTNLSYPKHFSTEFPDYAKNYLYNRKFNFEKIRQDWKILWGNILGDFKYRIIIPIYINLKLVSYTGRDVTHKAYSKYKHLNNEDSVLSIKETLYNYDNIPKGGKTIIVEGPTDVWRLGKSAVCTFGMMFTKEQVNLLRKKDLKKIYILFDNEPKAQQQAGRLGEALWFTSIEVLNIKTKKDPADLSGEEAHQVIQELGFN